MWRFLRSTKATEPTSGIDLLFAEVARDITIRVQKLSMITAVEELGPEFPR
jgi:cobalamin biosynthesis protein CobT